MMPMCFYFLCDENFLTFLSYLFETNFKQTFRSGTAFYLNLPPDSFNSLLNISFSICWLDCPFRMFKMCWSLSEDVPANYGKILFSVLFCFFSLPKWNKKNFFRFFLARLVSMNFLRVYKKNKQNFFCLDSGTRTV